MNWQYNGCPSDKTDAKNLDTGKIGIFYRCGRTS